MFSFSHVCTPALTPYIVAFIACLDSESVGLSAFGVGRHDVPPLQRGVVSASFILVISLFRIVPYHTLTWYAVSRCHIMEFLSADRSTVSLLMPHMAQHC